MSRPKFPKESRETGDKMAERRMFAKSVIDSDAFSDMPLTTQALYFHLGMQADDDGFVNNPKKIQRSIGATADDMKLLIAKGFIIPFDSGVIVITHWKVHNYIRKDRYRPTRHFHEMSQLATDESREYFLPSVSQVDTNGIPGDNQTDTQVRLGKDRLGKDRLEENICAEPLQASTPEPEEPAVISLPLNDKTWYSITQKQVDEWSGLYPAVDVMQELRKMVGWLDANPTKRKTKRGILRFVTGWLAREQDKGGNKKQSAPPKQETSFDLDEYERTSSWGYFAKKENTAAPQSCFSDIDPNYDPEPGVDPNWDYYKQRGGY